MRAPTQCHQLRFACDGKKLRNLSKITMFQVVIHPMVERMNCIHQRCLIPSTASTATNSIGFRITSHLMFQLQDQASVIVYSKWVVVYSGILGACQTRVLENLMNSNENSSQSVKSLYYCWWKNSCTSWNGKYRIIYRALYIPGGAGILPSTAPLAGQPKLRGFAGFEKCIIRRNRAPRCLVVVHDSPPDGTVFAHFCHLEGA